MLYELKEAPIYVKDSVVTKEYRKQESIIMQGFIDENIYFIESGVVQIVNYDEEGKQNSIFTQHKDTIFCEIELYRNSVPTFNVIALEKTTVHIVKKEMFIRWMNEEPDFLQLVYTQLVDKLLHSSRRQIEFLSKTLKERIITVLMNKNKNNQLTTLTKAQLCEEVYAPIRSVNRVLALIEDIVIYKDKRFQIISRKKG